MNIDPAALKDVFKSNYDRIALIAVLAGLLFSVGWLVIRLGEARKDLEQKPWANAEEQIKTTRPFDVTFLDEAIGKLGASNDVGALELPSMMVPALRVACVICRKPILFDAGICLFCGQAQPDDPKKVEKIVDTDGDGLPDEWEDKYNFNKNSAADVNEDHDKDYFTNIEEFKQRTNPRDTADSPPRALKLRLIKVTIMPLNLVFTSMQRVTGTTIIFTIKNKTTQVDYFEKLGGRVGEYTVTSFEEKYIEVPRPDMPAMPVKENVSVLTLKKEDRTLKLVMGQDVNQDEIVAELKFLPDETTYAVKINDVLDLKNHKYNVIDIKRDKVVILSPKYPRTLFEVKQDSVDTLVAPK